MSKLGDLFIRLGLKKDDFDKGIKDAEKSVKGFQVSTRAMAAAGAAAWAAVSAAVVRFAKDAVKMTQTWGDRWAVTMAGVQGAYGAFVRQLSSGEGFNNLFANMREASRVAREVAASMDEIFERTLSANYETAEIDNQIADLQKIQRDQSKSDQERLAAADKERELTAKKYDLLKDIQRQEAEGNRANLRAQTQLSDEQIDYLVKEYNANRDIINQARRYREERAAAAAEAGKSNRNTFGGIDLNAVAEAQRKVDERYGDSVKTIAGWTKLYDKSSDELVAKMARAEVAVIQLDTQAKHATDRADRLAGRLTADNGGGSPKTDPQLAAAQALQKDLATYGRTEVETIRAKYEEELALAKKYGLDVTTLTRKYQADILDAVMRTREQAESYEPVSIDVFEIDMDAVDQELEALNAKMVAEQERLLANAAAVRDALVQGIGGAVQEVADQMAGLEDVNPGAAIKALLTPLADMAVKEGEILIAAGIGLEAIKKALSSLNGVAAIAAGATLLAVGAAAKAGLSALAKGGASATTTSGAGYGAGSGSTTAQLETEMTIHVEGRLSGSDIVLAGQKTLNNWQR